MSTETDELIKTVKENTDVAVKEALKPILAENETLKAEVKKGAENLLKIADDADKTKQKLSTLEASRTNEVKDNAFKKSFEKSLPKIVSFKKKERGSVEIVLKADTDYENLTHSNVFNQLGTGVNDIAKKQVTLYDQFEKVPLNSEKYEYLYQASVTRDAKGVARCSKAFTSLTGEEIATEVVNYVKLKDVASVCEDFIDDYPFMMARVRNLLGDSISFLRDTELLKGTNTSTSLNSIDVVSSEFSAINPDAFIGATIANANYVDLMLAMATQMRTLGKLAKFRPNLVLVNDMDWFINVESAKDADGNYLDYRVRAVGDGSYIVGSFTILPLVDVDANTMYVMDRSKAFILDRQDIMMTLSRENGTNFVDGYVTLKVTTKLQFVVELNNTDAFMKCSDVSTAITSITIQ